MPDNALSDYNRGIVVRYQCVIAAIIFGGWVGITPVSAAGPVEDTVVFSAVAGGIYGSVDAVLRGTDVFRGFADGFNTGVVAPGMAIGWVSGIVAGAAVQTILLRPTTEADWVGWGAVGGVIGNLSGQWIYNFALARATNVSPDSVYPIILNSISVVRLGMAASDGIELGRRESTRSTSDADIHYMVMRELRDKRDPGTALAIGLGKEAADYFFGIGRPEWRDIQNDWEGTFHGINRY
ncbi:hypothetical protein EBR57_07575 [bacterium]|nr:hypothetical protein [bacterium]